jgi:hypothetical protein
VTYLTARTFGARVLLVAAVLALVAACSSGGAPGRSSPAGDSRAPTPAASATPVGVSTPDAAFARVVAAHPEFSGLQPRNPDLIGQCCWYEARAVESGYQVDVVIGWGDCPSGCIDNHRWTFSVAPSGETRLVSESGPSLQPGVIPSGPTT